MHPRHPLSHPPLLHLPIIPPPHRRYPRAIRSVLPQALQSRGYQKLVLQVGRGSLPQPSRSSALAVEAFRFKDSLAEDLRSADLVISHAGTARLLPGAAERVGMKSVCPKGGLAGSAELHS